MVTPESEMPTTLNEATRQAIAAFAAILIQATASHQAELARAEWERT